MEEKAERGDEQLNFYQKQWQIVTDAQGSIQRLGKNLPVNVFSHL